MKHKLLLLIISIFSIQLIGQPFLDFHTIASIPNSNPIEVELADVDLDSDLDVIVAYAGTSELVWYENLGQNNFGSPQIIKTSAAPLQLLVMDINVDGRPDVVYSDSNNKIFWFRNLGGVFSNELVIDNSIMTPIAIHSADIDGDGFEDLAVVSDISNEISWYRNLGTGNWSTRILMTTLNTRYLALGDLDHDGDPDLLVEDGQNIVWYENNGVGGFGNQTALLSNASQINGLFIEDVTEDGEPDPVFLANHEAGYRISLGNGNFTTLMQTQFMEDFNLFAFGNINGDVFQNMLLASSNASSPDEIYNVYINPFGLIAGGFTISDKPEINDFKIGDFKNDGDTDIVSCGADQVILIENIKPVDNDSDGFPYPIDCNDYNDAIYPGAPEICDGKDNDCDGVINEQAPDLVPQIFMLPNTITGYSQVDIAVRVVNLTAFPTDMSQITVRFPSSSRLTFVWNIGLQSAAFNNLNNADWNYLGNNSINHNFHYNGPGIVIPAYGSSTFGFQAFFDPQGASGMTSITVTVIPFSGGECVVNNNTASAKLIYFQ